MAGPLTSARTLCLGERWRRGRRGGARLPWRLACAFRVDVNISEVSCRHWWWLVLVQCLLELTRSMCRRELVALLPIGKSRGCCVDIDGSRLGASSQMHYRFVAGERHSESSFVFSSGLWAGNF